MLENLTARLAGIVKQIRGEARLTEANIQEALREVRIALLEADVALPVVKHFIEAVRVKALGAEVVGSLTPGQALVGVVHRELAALMGEANVPLDLATQPPAVILMAGLQGSGKSDFLMMTGGLGFFVTLWLGGFDSARMGMSMASLPLALSNPMTAAVMLPFIQMALTGGQIASNAALGTYNQYPQPRDLTPAALPDWLCRTGEWAETASSR